MRIRTGLSFAAVAAALLAATPAPAPALDWSTLPLPGAGTRAEPAQLLRCPRGYAPDRRGRCLRVRVRQRETDLDRHWRRYDPGVRYEALPPPGRPVPRFIFSFGPSQ